jgi:hypothetical protein
MKSRHASVGFSGSRRATISAPAALRLADEVDPGRLAELEAEARYHRERLELYRARVYSGRTTTVARMRELERLCEYAARRLRRAQRAAASHDGTLKQRGSSPPEATPAQAVL